MISLALSPVSAAPKESLASWQPKSTQFVWTRLADPFNTGFKDGLTAICVAPNGTLYVSGSGGVATSSNAGRTWTLINKGLPANPTVLTLGIAPTGSPLAAVGLGAYYYSGGAWHVSAGITSNLRVMAFTRDANGNVIAVNAWNADVYRSENSGQSYTRISAHVGSKVNYTAGALWTVVADHHGVLYTGGELQTGIYTSANDGEDWDSGGLSDAAGYNGNIMAIGFTSANVPVVGRPGLNGSCLQKLVRGQWTNGSVGIPLWYNAESVAADANGAMFVSIEAHNGSGDVYYSTDSATTWRSANSPLPTGVHGSVACDAQNLYVCINSAGQCAVWALPLASAK